MDKIQAEKVALFRFGLIAPVIHEANTNQRQYFKKVSETAYQVPGIEAKRSYSLSTLKNWLRQYRSGGIHALYPSTRSDAGTSKKIDNNLHQRIVAIIDVYPDLSSSGIYRELIRTGQMTKDDFTDVTLRNYIRNQGLRQAAQSKKARKKFEMPHVNMLWVSDFMHGPHLLDSEQHNRKRKTYLCAIIDDHSRMIVGARSLQTL